MEDGANLKRQCRINCGAGVVIPNVLPFLIPAVRSDDNTNTSTSNEEGDSGNDNDIDALDYGSSSSE